MTINNQHGFRNKLNCLTSLFDFFAQVVDTNDTDNNKAVDLVYLDFQKAFEMVPHERLMLKVNARVIHGAAARWIRNLLASRRQRVYINQSYSNFAPVTSVRGGPPTTSRFTQRDAGLLDGVKIGPPTRTRVTPGNPVSVGNTYCWLTLNNFKNSRVAAAVLLDRWFVYKQTIFLSGDVVKGVGYYHGIFMRHLNLNY